MSVIEFNPVVYRTVPKLQVEQTILQFAQTYELFQTILDEVSKTELPLFSHSLKQEVLRYKTELSRLCLDLYRAYPQNGDDKGLEAFYKNIIHEATRNRNILPVDYIIADSYLLPLFKEDEEIRFPLESIWATVENLEIVQTFKDAAKNTAEGMLMSGTHAWGPFYAVKGGRPRKIPAISGGNSAKVSDLDLLVAHHSISGLEATVEDFVAKGFLESKELLRFKIFKQLAALNQADIFSVRSDYCGLEESIHFIPWEILERISRCVDKEGSGLDVTRDFRPNKPGNVLKYGGYPTGDLKGLANILLKPSIKMVEFGGKDDLGYISETTIGGSAKVRGVSTYFIGVLPFYLLISPVVLVDNNGRFSALLNEYTAKIRNIMDGQMPTFIPRQERMDPDILIRIKISLS